MTPVDPMSKRAQDVLRRYREAESLAAPDVARLLSSVERSVAAGSAGSDPSAGGSGVGAHTAGGKLLAGIAPKILLGMFVAAVPAAWALRAEHAPEASVSVSPAQSSVVAVARPGAGASPGSDLLAHGAWRPSPATAWQPVATPSPSARATSDAVPVAAFARPEPRATHTAPAPSGMRASALASAPRATATGAAPRETPSAGSSARASGVDEEVRLLGQAYAQLRAHQPSLALATLAEEDRRFPDGKLSEARQVARIIALCDAGQHAAARSEGARFLSAHPGSPFTSRVRAACVE